MMCGVQTRSAADGRCLKAKHLLGSEQNPTDDDTAHCMGLYGPLSYPLDMLH